MQYKYVQVVYLIICGYEYIHMRVCKNVNVITPVFIGSLSVMASSKNNFVGSHNFRSYRACKGSVLSLLQLFNITLCLHVWHIYQQIHWAEHDIVIWQLKVPYTEHIWVRDGQGVHSTSQNSREKCEGNHPKTSFFQSMKPSFFLHFQGFQHHHSPKYIYKKRGVSSPKVFSLLGMVIYNRWMQHWRYPFILMAPWRSAGRTWRTDVGTRPICGHWYIQN